MATLLHPPPAGGLQGQISLPLVPMDGPEAGETATGAIDDDREAGGEAGDNSDDVLKIDEAGKISAPSTTNATDSPSSAKLLAGHASGAAGRFASRLMDNVQRHLAKNGTISGTLTLSLELIEDDGELGEAPRSVGKLGGPHGLQEPRPPRPPGGYSTVKFHVAQDIAAERKRRQKEGINVPQMLSRVEALHHELEGLNAGALAICGLQPQPECSV